MIPRQPDPRCPYCGGRLVWLTEHSDRPLAFIVNGRTYADGLACAAPICRGLYPDAAALRVRQQRILILKAHSPFRRPVGWTHSSTHLCASAALAPS